MKNNKKIVSEAIRLENFWNGDFGNRYIERNRVNPRHRADFLYRILKKYPSQNILEVGCNIGLNIHWLVKKMPQRQVFGLDINEKALRELKKTYPYVNAVYGTARSLPFRDQYFDLVFTAGVLIHQPPEMLPLVMGEIVRCARKYVLADEYFAEKLTEVPYRGHRKALFKLDFGKMYQELFPQLLLRETGFLPAKAGWDDFTYWVFEKP